MGEEQLTPEFKKKLQEWKRMKKTGGGTTSPEPALPQPQQLRRRLTDWQIWRTPTKTEGKNDAAAATATDGEWAWESERELFSYGAYYGRSSGFSRESGEKEPRGFGNCVRFGCGGWDAIFKCWSWKEKENVIGID